MERWENRYANGRSGGGRSAENARMDRVKNVVIILLLVALVGVGIAGGQAIAFRGEAREMIIARALTESGEAVGHVNTMSRSGGSDTAGVLGKIRANINAIDVLSGICQGLYNQALVPQASLNQLYETIDSYSGKLRNGTATIEELTRLSDGLTGLREMLNAAR